jgi:hypothetical protein
MTTTSQEASAWRSLTRSSAARSATSLSGPTRGTGWSRTARARGRRRASPPSGSRWPPAPSAPSAATSRVPSGRSRSHDPPVLPGQPPGRATGRDRAPRLGGVDSFASSLAYGFLAAYSPQLAVEYGAAHGALAMTTPGDTSMATLSEEQVMQGSRASGAVGRRSGSAARRFGETAGAILSPRQVFPGFFDLAQPFVFLRKPSFCLPPAGRSSPLVPIIPARSGTGCIPGMGRACPHDTKS